MYKVGPRDLLVREMGRKWIVVVETTADQLAFAVYGIGLRQGFLFLTEKFRHQGVVALVIPRFRGNEQPSGYLARTVAADRFFEDIGVFIEGGLIIFQIGDPRRLAQQRKDGIQGIVGHAGVIEEGLLILVVGIDLGFEFFL